jgi:hypothetical protein
MWKQRAAVGPRAQLTNRALQPRTLTGLHILVVRRLHWRAAIAMDVQSSPLRQLAPDRSNCSLTLTWVSCLSTRPYTSTENMALSIQLY